MSLSSCLPRAKRSAPRIISRSYEKLRRIEGGDLIASPHNASAPPSPPLMPNDVEQELQSEIYMKGGVVVSTASNRNTSYNTQITHDNGVTTDEGEKAGCFVELPGVANEVESYPCPICGPDKVFLTATGLERHTQDEHPHECAKVDAHVARIQKEWARRRVFGIVSNSTAFELNLDYEASDNTNARIVDTLRTDDILVDDTAPCRTRCRLCGLVIIRPSLLLRHMLRVHGRTTFSAEVFLRHGVAPLKFTILADGHVSWTCCEVNFKDRENALAHRSQIHSRLINDEKIFHDTNRVEILISDQNSIKMLEDTPRTKLSVLGQSQREGLESEEEEELIQRDKKHGGSDQSQLLTQSETDLMNNEDELDFIM